MRKIFNEQLKIGAVEIGKIEIDLKSRDQIPKVLLGLQYIYTHEEIRKHVFDLLEELIPKKSRKKLGRNGMSMWEIFVLSCIKLRCATDFDRLKDIADNHNTARKMLGLSPVIDEKVKYGLQTLKDNLQLMNPDVLKLINYQIVKYEQTLAGKNAETPFFARCDSFVTRTNVHFPTDISLMFDAIRKVMVLTSRLCDSLGLPGWKQSDANLKKVKKHYRIAQKLKHSTSKDQKKREERNQLILQAYEDYIDIVKSYLDMALIYIDVIRNEMPWMEVEVMSIEHYIAHADRQIDQTYRRVIQNEKIPHDEKIFSIFEEHTEWICKGKAGVPQEFGIRIAVVEDEYGFIIDYMVAQNQTDDKIAVPLLKKAKKTYPDLNGCIFDKAFYTPLNKQELKQLLKHTVLPKKGKRNAKEQIEETDEMFQKARKQHSAVESSIASLQNHGLKLCRDKGIGGFNRYIAIGILSFNIHKLGALLQEQERKKNKRRKKYNKTYAENRKYQAA
jgi:transposase, IS5 family